MGSADLHESASKDMHARWVVRDNLVPQDYELDELTNVVSYDWVAAPEAVEGIARRSPKTNVVVDGPPDLVDLTDTATCPW